MTDYLFPEDVLPVDDSDIEYPEYEHTAEALKRVGLNESKKEYKDVANQFDYCKKNKFFCVLCIWRGKKKEWMFFYKRSYPWPIDNKPLVGQRKKAYYASKGYNHHFFNMDGDFTGAHPRYEEPKRSV